MHDLLQGLARLACPAGMGVMMWMMMRAGRRRPSSADSAVAAASEDTSQVDALRAQIELLKAEPAARPARAADVNGA